MYLILSELLKGKESFSIILMRVLSDGVKGQTTRLEFFCAFLQLRFSSLEIQADKSILLGLFAFCTYKYSDAAI